MVIDAQSNAVYEDDEFMVPKNTCVVIKRTSNLKAKEGLLSRLKRVESDSGAEKPSNGDAASAPKADDANGDAKNDAEEDDDDDESDDELIKKMAKSATQFRVGRRGNQTFDTRTSLSKRNTLQRRSTKQEYPPRVLEADQMQPRQARRPRRRLMPQPPDQAWSWDASGIGSLMNTTDER